MPKSTLKGHAHAKQYNSCWSPGDWRSQVISRYDIDLVCTEYFGVRTATVNDCCRTTVVYMHIYAQSSTYDMVQDDVTHQRTSGCGFPMTSHRKSAFSPSGTAQSSISPRNRGGSNSARSNFVKKGILHILKQVLHECLDRHLPDNILLIFSTFIGAYCGDKFY